MMRRVLLIAFLACELSSAGVALAKKTFVYVHDRRNGGFVWGFTMDRRGKLAAVPGSPFALVDSGEDCTGLCQTMAYASKRRVLLTAGDTGLTSWTVAKNGALAAVGGAPVAGGAPELGGTAVVQTGKRVFAYSASFPAAAVLGFEVMKDGSVALLPGAPVATGAGPVGMDARRTAVFVANEDGLSLSVYAASSDGTLTPAPGSPVALPGAVEVFNVNPDPRGARVYVADDGDADGGRIFGFAVDRRSAALTPLAGSPVRTFSVGGKTGIAVAKKLLFAFDFEDGTNDIQPFAIGRDGSLTPTGIIIDSRLSIDAHAIDAAGKRLVVVSGSRIVTAAVSGKDGSLDTLDSTSLPGINANAVLIVKR
jgi:hypothetical protein